MAGLDEPIGGDAQLDEWLAFAPETPEEEPTRRIHPLEVISGLLAVAVVVGLVALRPTGLGRQDAIDELSVLGVPSQFHSADVAAVEDAPCDFDPGVICTTVSFLLTEGPDEGATYEQIFSSDSASPTLDEGDKVVLSYRPPNGVVATSSPVACDFDPTAACADVTVRVTAGDLAGQTFTQQVVGAASDFSIGSDADIQLQEDNGQVVVVGVASADVATQYQFADFQRRSVLLWVLIIFAVSVIALGRWRGVAALIGLGATVLLVVWWLLPAILDGRSPVLVALVGSAAIAYLALYLAHGFSLMSTVALLGTLAALALTTLLSAGTVSLAHFTGLTSEESTLLTLFQGIDIRGLVLAGMVLGAAGAIDDVTVTQASAVWRLHHAEPSQSRWDLFHGGMQIGRDHIGSTVNTLLLAYLGAALPLAILLVVAEQSLGSVVNSEVVAIEVVRTLVGSIGLVAAVPLTTYMAAMVRAGES
jgi:uncharacterized membrane protein